MDFEQITNIFHQREPKMIRNNDRRYAILLPLIERDNELHVLFEVRAPHLKRQPNEICFPGGKIENSDLSEAYAAVRETSEELGIKPRNIIDVFPLDYVISDIAIFPFIGKILYPEQIIVNTEEVAEIFTVPLSYLMEAPVTIHTINLKPEPAPDFPYDLIPGGKNYPWGSRKLVEPFYQYEDRVIWGLTARILHHFLETIKKNSQ